MAKEQVNIVFSADSAQARKLFEEISTGLERAGKKTQQTSKQMDSFGGTVVKVVSTLGMAGAALRVVNTIMQNSEQHANKTADAFTRLSDAASKIRGEGGLSEAAEQRLRKPIINASLHNAVDLGTSRLVAQQMLEDKFSDSDIAGGGLDAMIRGIVAINARGEGADPKQLSKSVANIMQTLGRSPTTGNIESTFGDMHGLMNATGLDVGGAEGLIGSMARASKPKMAKLLKTRGLTPGQIDPNALGIGPAGQALARATEGMSESEQLTFLSRLLGDEGGTAFQRGRGEFASGRVSSSSSAMERDWRAATSGFAAETRREGAWEEHSMAERGETAARYRLMRDRGRRLNQDSWMGRALDATVETTLRPIAETFGGDEYKSGAVRRSEGAVKVEITTPNGGRLDGRVRGTQHLKPLQN